MQPSSSPLLFLHRCLAMRWKVFIVTPLSSRALLLVLFSPTTPCTDGGGGTLSGVVVPQLRKASASEKEDLIKAERNEPGKTTGVHLSRSRRSGLLFLRSFFYLAIFPVSTNNRLRPPPSPLYPNFILQRDNGVILRNVEKKSNRTPISRSKAGVVERMVEKIGGGALLYRCWRTNTTDARKRSKASRPFAPAQSLCYAVLIPLSRKRSERARMG